MIIANIPISGLKGFIESLAQKHDIQYARTSDDALAEVVTRLAGDVVITDETEDLIVALKRADVIDAETMVALLGNYLDEKKGSR